MNLQHGDVLIKQIKAMPDGAKEVSREVVGIVVARGEHTGHSHVITEKTARMCELKGELYLEVVAPVVITHEEHKPLTIPTGIYQIGTVKEYDYFKEMERKVQD